MEKINEVNAFHNSIEKKYKQLMEELMQKDCQRVEFIRGMLFVYSEILIEKRHWKKEVKHYL
jgi:hypothetical protein